MDLFLDASDFDMLADFTDPTDVDSSFAPMPRERANTWHGRPRDSPKDDDSSHATPSFADDSIDGTASTSSTARDHVQGSAHIAVRKATARRNAWGNMSYADLIAKAIESTPDKRLTLSEIYAWLVENVPFFKDKGETNSSAGWKNSIRHNLSLHNRFIRVQNEGAGKSSWWMVNPDNRTVKAPRRRAATMDNSKALNQKRGRQRRSEPTNPTSSTNPSSTSGADLDGSSLQSFFTRSPEFRGRVSSNASSIGRLSPIPATFEVDMEPATSIAPSGAVFASWNNPTATAADTLSDCLAGILMDDLKKSPDLVMTSAFTSTVKAESVFLQAGSTVNFPGDFFNRCQYPPPLQHTPIQVFGASQQIFGASQQPKTEVFTVQPLGGMSSNSMSGVSMLCVGGNMSGNGGVSISGLQLNARQQLYKTPSVNDIQLQVATAPDQLFSATLAFSAAPEQSSFSAVSQSQSPSGLASMQWSGQQEWSASQQQQKLPGQSLVQQWPKPELENKAEDAGPQTRQRSFTFSSGKLDQNTLRQLLVAKPCLRTDIQKLLQMKRQQLYAAEQLRGNPATPEFVSSCLMPDDPLPSVHSHHSMLEQLLTGAMAEPLSKSTDALLVQEEEMKMDVVPSATLPNDHPNPPSDLPNDIDLSYLNTESSTDIECNIDQIIQHELTFGDELDFSFDPVQQPNWGNNVGSSGDSLTNFLSY